MISKFRTKASKFNSVFFSKFQLECEIEKLRSEASLVRVGDKAAAESLKHILSGTRKELDDERKTSNHLQKEIEKLRARIDELLVR